MRKSLIALAALAILACSRDPDSPEAAVRATLAAIEAAASERDVDALTQHVSVAYADARGNDKNDLVGIAALHLLRNQAVYTFSRIGTIDTREPGGAQVEALVALAGRPIPDEAALATLSADLYRFDLRLREEEPGTWRVVAADWKRATLSDFR